MIANKKKITLAEVKAYGNLEFMARQMVEGFITGLHKSPYHGFSVEFAEHKIFNPGESTRLIDWKVFAKSDRLYTKRFEEETNLRCQILLDVSKSMYYPADTKGKLLFSSWAAACLIYLLQKQRDAFGITTFNDKVVYQSQTKSTSTHAGQIYQHLQRLLDSEPIASSETSVSQTIHTIADQLKQRALVIIFTDMLENEPLESVMAALRHLKYNKHEVVLFHTVDKSTEIDFQFDNRPHIFEDLETGEKMKLQPNQYKEAYTKAATSFREEIKLRCFQYKIDFIEADIEGGIEQVLLPYLIKRKKMG